VGEQRKGGVAVPGVIAADLVVVQAGLVLRALEALLSSSSPVLADNGYQGSTWAKIPYRGKGKSEPQKEANRAHAKLRAPGGRANALLKNWRVLRKLRCCPWLAPSSPKPSTPWRSTPRN
jgi:DDE superfamily endonuclease